MYDHHRNPRNASGLANPSFTKHSEETSCGDEGEFHAEIAADGTIERLGFESRSCAVSTAVASMLTEYLEGETLETAAELDGVVADLLDGEFPDLRHDCVVGPEQVIREGAAEFLDASEK
nr:iron-sulfur cluster assembly scaffold protein [Halorussus amylolyticus]